MNNLIKSKLSLAGISLIGGLVIGGTVYNGMSNSRNGNERILLGQRVCDAAKVLELSYQGTFQVPINGVEFEGTTLEIELKLADINTISCQFLSPSLRDSNKKNISYHSIKIRNLLTSMALKSSDTAPLIVILDHIDKVNQ